MKHETRFLWLDLVRGCSALAVCAGHLRAAIFVDYPQLQAASFLQKAFYALTGLGHQAVMVFFVLSGFFVGGSILRSGKNFRGDNYAIARLSRLWIVLVPALIITFIIDQLIGMRAPGVLKGAYYSIWNSGPSSDGSYSNTFVTFIGNVFFLQTVLTPVFGTNSPLWSLANEFWYYVLFPLCAYSCGRCYNANRPRVAARMVVGGIALAMFFFIPAGMRAGYFIWLLGVLVYLVLNRWQTQKRLFQLIGSMLFLCALAYSRSTAWQTSLNLSSDLAVGIGFSVFCCAIANSPPPSFLTSPFIVVARWLSEISYSLYLSHFPFVVLIGALFYGSKQMAPNLIGFAHYFGLFAFLLINGTAFWWLFEKRTTKLREFALAHLSRRASAQEPIMIRRKE